jgi:integrase
MSKLATGTRAGYKGAWRQWVWFCRARKRDPYLSGRPEAKREEEDLLLDFVTHLFKWFRRTEGTVKTKLMAVRYHHICEGLKDPLKDQTRVWLALGGVKRALGERKRQWPATLPMMEWMEENFTMGNDKFVVYAAAALAWFFLLRGGEYAEVEGQPWQLSRVLTGMDVIPRREGARVGTFKLADEVVVYLKGSKTDQYNAGQIRNHYRSGERFCPVGVMESLERRHPERWKDEAHLPLFRFGNGTTVKRKDISKIIKQAAVAIGADPERFDAHALRRGGASAMHQAGIEKQVIQQFGRWKSDAYFHYLWDAHETQKGLSTTMARTRFELTDADANPKRWTVEAKRKVLDVTEELEAKRLRCRGEERATPRDTHDGGTPWCTTVESRKARCKTGPGKG